MHANRSHPRTIALMIESDGPGGAETVLLHLAEGLRGRGYSVVPVVPGFSRGKEWLRRQFRDRGFEPELFYLRHALDWRCVTGLKEIFRRRGVEVVHSHEFTMAVYGSIAARQLGLPHIITMHGGKNFAQRWRRRAALRWAVRHSRAAASVSGAAAGFLEHTLGLSDGTVRVVANGIDPRPGRGESIRAELHLAPDEALVVAVGNLYPVKGHIVLLKALAHLHTASPELRWKAAIAGRGEEEPALREFLERQNLTDRVTLLGFRDDVPDILAAADIWVMPSFSEGLPLSLLEAMFAGKAIVASRVGGIPEVVAEEQEALLAPAGDEMEFARHLGRLIGDPALRSRLGDAAREHARRDYQLTRTLDQYESLYREPVTG
jgi:glycosyltransferase involved in cell wall biosynthesis